MNFNYKDQAKKLCNEAISKFYIDEKDINKKRMSDTVYNDQ